MRTNKKFQFFFYGKKFYFMKTGAKNIVDETKKKIRRWKKWGKGINCGET